MKLTEISGADSVLPGKKEIKEVDTEGWSNKDDIASAHSDNGHAYGFNEYRASLETVSLVLDVEKMARIMYEDNQRAKNNVFPMKWEDLTDIWKKPWMEIAKALAENANLFARLEKSK